VAVDFFGQVFGRCPADLYVLIWRRAGKRSAWFPVAKLDEAAAFAAAGTNVYFGVALSPEDFGPLNRCEADRTACIVGLWADIDIKHTAHKTSALPETLEQALELADSLGINPTIRVDSGHGLQTYWLFNEPWIFGDDAERQQARQLVERFQAALKRKAEERRWKLDSTQDLARILRVPGTTNHKPKCQPVPVQMLDASGPRYDRHELDARLPEGHTSSLALHATARLDDRELALLALAALKSARFDDYDSWLKIGMALHAVDPSATMCGEWDRASRCIPDKYEEGVCAEKWATFSVGGGVGLGTLIQWAEEDGWQPPWAKRPAQAQRVEPAAPSAAVALAATEQLAIALLDVINTNPTLLLAWQQALTIKGTDPCA
jgi:hypothetical protein